MQMQESEGPTVPNTEKHTPNRVIRVPDDMWKLARQQATAEGTTVSVLMRSFLAWWLRLPGAKLPRRPPAEGAPPVPDSHKPEHPPVVAAIVTSPLGALISRRNAADPPWGFIAGKVEPGESIADAAVREVKEETGLVIEPAPQEIGRRVHPMTGKLMIYLACTPKGRLDPIVGDEEELAEVKWASLAEAEQLLPGMFDPVRDYLRREIGEAK